MILSGCTSLAYLVGSALPLLMMDKFGRRILLMVSAAGLCLCFVMVAILLSIGKTQDAYGATAFIFLFQIFYGLGWLPVPWFYPSEVGNTLVSLSMFPIADFCLRLVQHAFDPRMQPSPLHSTGSPSLQLSRSHQLQSVSLLPACLHIHFLHGLY